MIKMTEKQKDPYLKTFLLILVLAAILDSYSTSVQNAIQTSVTTAFLGPGTIFEGLNSDVVLAFGGLFVSFGLYFVFFIQVLLDKFGRKRMMMVTTLGMTICAFLLLLSQNFFMYLAILFFNSFFYNADVFIAYASEEAEANKRMKLVNVILIGGLLGSLLMIIARSMLIKDTYSEIWRGMFIIPIFVGILATLLIQTKLKESSKYELAKTEREENPRVLREEIRALFKIEEAQSYKFLLIVALIFGMTHSLTLFLGQKYAVETLLVSEAEFSMVILLTMPGILLVYAINGILADRIGRKPLLYMYSIIVPIAILLFLFATPILGNRIVFIVYPLATMAYWGVYNSIRQLTLETVPTRIRGTGIGLRVLAFAMGSSLGLGIGGLIILGTSNTALAFGILECLNFINIPIVMKYVKETKDNDLAQIK